jgi:hypothetical protein
MQNATIGQRARASVLRALNEISVASLWFRQGDAHSAFVVSWPGRNFGIEHDLVLRVTGAEKLPAVPPEPGIVWS